MTKQEAIIALESGQNLVHEYFIQGEYIYSKNSKIYDENGIELINFWKQRTDRSWEEGWSIYVTN